MLSAFAAWYSVSEDFYLYAMPGFSAFATWNSVSEDFYLDAMPGRTGDFPDFLYACGNDHDAGEMARWPPFQAAAATYIRQRPDSQSGRWTKDTQKLAAFL